MVARSALQRAARRQAAVRDAQPRRHLSEDHARRVQVSAEHAGRVRPHRQGRLLTRFSQTNEQLLSCCWLCVLFFFSVLVAQEEPERAIVARRRDEASVDREERQSVRHERIGLVGELCFQHVHVIVHVQHERLVHIRARPPPLPQTSRPHRPTPT